MSIRSSDVLSALSIAIATASAAFSYQANMIAGQNLGLADENFVATIKQQTRRNSNIELSSDPENPYLKAKWRVTIANASTNTSTVMDYQSYVRSPDGNIFSSDDNILYVADTNKRLLLPFTIEAGKYLVLEGVFTFAIAKDAYSVLKNQEQPMTLLGADDALLKKSIEEHKGASEIQGYGLFGVRKLRKVENPEAYAYDRYKTPTLIV